MYTLPKSTKGGSFDVNNHRSVISCARLMFLPNSYVNLLGLNYAFTTHYTGACVYPNFKVSGSRVGVVVRELASHQCVPGSIPGPCVRCGLSLLLALYSAPRGFSPGTPVFLSPQKPTFLNSNSIWIIAKHIIISLWLG